MSIRDVIAEILGEDFDPKGLVVTSDDLIKSGACCRGLARERSNMGFSKDQLKQFLSDGITADNLCDFEDFRIEKTVRVAAERVNSERG